MLINENIFRMFLLKVEQSKQLIDIFNETDKYYFHDTQFKRKIFPWEFHLIKPFQYRTKLYLYNECVWGEVGSEERNAITGSPGCLWLSLCSVASYLTWACVKHTYKYNDEGINVCMRILPIPFVLWDWAQYIIPIYQSYK